MSRHIATYCHRVRGLVTHSKQREVTSGDIATVSLVISSGAVGLLWVTVGSEVTTTSSPALWASSMDLIAASKIACTCMDDPYGDLFR